MHIAEKLCSAPPPPNNFVPLPENHPQTAKYAYIYTSLLIIAAREYSLYNTG